MGKNSVIFNPRRNFQVFWMEKEGTITSFRFKTEEASERVGKLIEAGWDLKPDPFRKGAPVGGFQCK